MFFPKRGESQKPGKTLCAPCPVKTECAEFAQRTNSTHGMWAGVMQKRTR